MANMNRKGLSRAMVKAPRGVPKSGDKVPVKLEHGEAVLPKQTVAKVGPQNIARLIADTNGRGPKRSLKAGQGYAFGGVFDGGWDKIKSAAGSAADYVGDKINSLRGNTGAASGAAPQAATSGKAGPLPSLEPTPAFNELPNAGAAKIGAMPPIAPELQIPPAGGATATAKPVATAPTTTSPAAVTGQNVAASLRPGGTGARLGALDFALRAGEHWDATGANNKAIDELDKGQIVARDAGNTIGATLGGAVGGLGGLILGNGTAGKWGGRAGMISGALYGAQKGTELSDAAMGWVRGRANALSGALGGDSNAFKDTDSLIKKSNEYLRAQPGYEPSMPQRVAQGTNDAITRIAGAVGLGDADKAIAARNETRGIGGGAAHPAAGTVIQRGGLDLNNPEVKAQLARSAAIAANPNQQFKNGQPVLSSTQSAAPGTVAASGTGPVKLGNATVGLVERTQDIPVDGSSFIGKMAPASNAAERGARDRAFLKAQMASAARQEAQAAAAADPLAAAAGNNPFLQQAIAMNPRNMNIPDITVGGVNFSGALRAAADHNRQQRVRDMVATLSDSAMKDRSHRVDLAKFNNDVLNKQGERNDKWIRSMTAEYNPDSKKWEEGGAKYKSFLEGASMALGKHGLDMRHMDPEALNDMYQMHNMNMSKHEFANSLLGKFGDLFSKKKREISMDPYADQITGTGNYMGVPTVNSKLSGAMPRYAATGDTLFGPANADSASLIRRQVQDNRTNNR